MDNCTFYLQFCSISIKRLLILHQLHYRKSTSMHKTTLSYTEGRNPLGELVGN